MNQSKTTHTHAVFYYYLATQMTDYLLSELFSHFWDIIITSRQTKPMSSDGGFMSNEFNFLQQLNNKYFHIHINP